MLQKSTLSSGAVFRPLVKSLERDMILVAEFWGDARSLLRGKTFDSVMNYPFQRRHSPVEYVFRAGNSAAKFAAMTNLYLNAYPPQTLHSLWNILDSHDTERILTLAFNQVDLSEDSSGDSDDLHRQPCNLLRR